MMTASDEPSAYYPMDSNGLAVQNALASRASARWLRLRRRLPARRWGITVVVVANLIRAIHRMKYGTGESRKYKECMNQKPTH
jgi:hypothetical protein